MKQAARFQEGCTWLPTSIGLSFQIFMELFVHVSTHFPAMVCLLLFLEATSGLNLVPAYLSVWPNEGGLESGKIP